LLAANQGAAVKVFKSGGKTSVHMKACLVTHRAGSGVPDILRPGRGGSAATDVNLNRARRRHRPLPVSAAPQKRLERMVAAHGKELPDE
jgi:hypothetical protein